MAGRTCKLLQAKIRWGFPGRAHNLGSRDVATLLPKWAGLSCATLAEIIDDGKFIVIWKKKKADGDFRDIMTLVCPLLRKSPERLRTVLLKTLLPLPTHNASARHCGYLSKGING